jgi:hypothetical protein
VIPVGRFKWNIAEELLYIYTCMFLLIKEREIYFCKSSWLFEIFEKNNVCNKQKLLQIVVKVIASWNSLNLKTHTRSWR